jgi:hypothetical protein
MMALHTTSKSPYLIEAYIFSKFKMLFFIMNLILTSI